MAYGKLSLPNIISPFLALSSLNSNVYSFPFGPTADAMEDDNEPLPVPLSTTIEPGLIFNLRMIRDMSARNSIYVLCGMVSVMRYGVGLSSCICPVKFLECMISPCDFPTNDA